MPQGFFTPALLFFSFIASFCHPRPFLSPASFHHRNPLFMKENWRPFLNLSRSNMTTGAGPRGTRTYLELFPPWQENTPVANAVKPAVIIHRPYTAWDTWGSFLVTSQCGRPGSEHNSSRSLTGSPVRSFVSGSELTAREVWRDLTLLNLRVFRVQSHS